ncbi:MAG: hypothetical protein RQ731_05730 [Anaerosomatales bacterium]|nr:hypothetical protein [Anaerosomatales bacterium]MDT8434238.1 hypothetical protein [Anaerosomatales bacterium]
MARRNPANPRYQKGHELGKTRRSSASAKPKRAAGDTATQAAKPKKKQRPSLLAPVPPDPEYRRWRKIWLALLGAAIVFSALAWWQQTTLFGNIVLGLAYGCIFAAFYIDFTKLRKMRKAAIEAAKAAKSPGKKADKNAAKKGADAKAAATKTESDSDS